MAEPFSIAASSFAVVGVADVVLRASIECCRFLSDIKDAPAEIDRLRTCIKENSQLVDTLKKHLDDLRDPTSSMSLSAPNLSSALDAFNSSVRALDRELNALRTLAKRHTGPNKTWTRVKWLLDERKISKSLEKLERSKATLSVALSLVEGRRSAIRRERSDVVIRRNFQRIKSTMNSQLQELAIVKATQENVLSSQDKVVNRSTQQSRKTALLRQDLLKATRTDRIEHAKTRGKIADGNRQVIDTISSRLDDLRMSIPKAPIVAPKSNRKIHFIGPCRESILTPLLLMKDHVRRAVLHGLSHHVERLSPHHLYWLQSEFEKLVSSATQEAAAFCQGSTATSFDHWDYMTGANTLPDTDLSLGTLIARDDYEGDSRVKTTAESRGTGCRRGFRLRYENFSYSSPVGKLHLTIPRTSSVADFAPSIDDACLSFLPSRGICSNPISARFVKYMHSGLEPRLYTQLNAYRLVESDDLHTDIIGVGSIEDIDAAFRSGKISPYDQDGSGMLLCHACAYACVRLEVLQYLDRQGVGLSSMNGDLYSLRGFWYTLQSVEISAFHISIDRCRKVQAYLEETTIIGTLSTQSRLLHSYEKKFEHDYSEERVQLIKTWMQFLKQNDYDFESQDIWDRTALLDHLKEPGGPSLAIVRLLLEFGASSHAIDIHGCNAVQLAMLSTVNKYRDEAPEILEEKLSLLIEAGVDLHHRDIYGATPSRYASYRKCWAVWCRALERNGRNIVDVIREDGELWLRKENSKGEEESDKEEGDEEEGDKEEGDEEESDQEEEDEGGFFFGFS